MRDFNFNNGILHIKVNGYGDEILLDSADITVFKRFTEMYDNVQRIADEADEKLGKVKEGHQVDNDVPIAGVTASVNIYLEHIQKIVTELDNVFGSGFVQKVYRENYELNPNFVPDELSIEELIGAMIPIMEDAYGERIRRNKNKYSAEKRGKHTKTKDELIAEYREKNAHE